MKSHCKCLYSFSEKYLGVVKTTPREGIVRFNVSGWSDASGHFELFDGANVLESHGDYFDPAKLGPRQKVISVQFWETN